MHAASWESWKVGEKGVLYIGCNRHVGPMKKVSKELFPKKFHSFYGGKRVPSEKGRFSSATLNFNVVVTRGQHLLVLHLWWIVKKLFAHLDFVTKIFVKIIQLPFHLLFDSSSPDKRPSSLSRTHKLVHEFPRIRVIESIQIFSSNRENPHR